MGAHLPPRYSPARLWQKLAEGSNPSPTSDSSDPCPVGKVLLLRLGCIETSLHCPGPGEHCDPGPRQHGRRISKRRRETKGAMQTGKACGDSCSGEDAQPASLEERGPLPHAHPCSSVLTSCAHVILAHSIREISTFLVRKQKRQCRRLPRLIFKGNSHSFGGIANWTQPQIAQTTHWKPPALHACGTGPQTLSELRGQH